MREGQTRRILVCHEAGGGQLYTQPKGGGPNAYIELPSGFFTNGWINELPAAAILVLLMGLGIAIGVDFEPTWAFVPVVVPMLLTMAGLTLVLSSLAPSAEVGGIINGMVGILPVMLSPVFFTMEQAPLLLRWFGWVSPFRYAADGIMKALSGRTDVWTEVAILTGFAVTMMAVGFWRLHWRER
ncbi:MAG: ABC transporter permease [Chloroflexi bacterium]|nr:ABC transporter permease [Chloroflexota bacterium]